MLPRNPLSRIILLGASLLTQHTDSAPIPLVTHPDGKTTIWVTNHNTLNTTRAAAEKSLHERQAPQWFGQPGVPIINSPPDEAWGPGTSPFQPPGVNPNQPPNGPWTTGNTLWPTFTSYTTETTSAAITSTVFATSTSAETTSSAAPSPESTSASPTIISASAITTTQTLSSTFSTFSSVVLSTSPASSTTPSSTSVVPPPAPPPTTSTIASTTAAVPTTPQSTPAPAPTSSTTSTSAAPAPPPTSSTTPATTPLPSTTASLSTASSASPVTTTSVVTSSTPPASSSAPPAPSGTPPAGSGNSLQISLVNNLGSSNANAYVTGLDSNGEVVMLTTDGTYYYLPTNGTGVPQTIYANVALPLKGPGETTTITLPDYLSAARVWFADGTLTFSYVSSANGPALVEPTTQNPSDPSADVNWGFIELTFKADYGLFANLSFVDFVGLPLGIELRTTSGQVQKALGLKSNAVSDLCDKLKGQTAKDGQPWDQLCTYDGTGNLLRVVSPPTLIAHDTSNFIDYWDAYVNQVWDQYTTETLTINSQNAAGMVQCTSDGSAITCPGPDSAVYAYPKPSAEDIFGCNSGTFAIPTNASDIQLAVVPRLCAALNRATLHLTGGNVQPSLPPSSYYTSTPNNWYSAFVHEIESDGLGYAFSYDDVAPSAEENQSGSVFAANPSVLTVFVGGSNSS